MSTAVQPRLAEVFSCEECPHVVYRCRVALCPKRNMRECYPDDDSPDIPDDCPLPLKGKWGLKTTKGAQS